MWKCVWMIHCFITVSVVNCEGLHFQIFLLPFRGYNNKYKWGLQCINAVLRILKISGHLTKFYHNLILGSSQSALHSMRNDQGCRKNCQKHVRIYYWLTSGHFPLTRTAILAIICIYCRSVKVFVSTALINPLPATASYVIEDANFTSFGYV